MSRGYDPRFDLDRAYGEEGEALLAQLRELGMAGSIEVKRTSYVDEWLYVETSHAPQRGTFKPSGIHTTQADYWAFVVSDTGIVLLVPTEVLRECLAAGWGKPREETDGDNPTRGELVSINALFAFWKRRK